MTLLVCIFIPTLCFHYFQSDCRAHCFILTIRHITITTYLNPVVIIMWNIWKCLRLVAEHNIALNYSR